MLTSSTPCLCLSQDTLVVAADGTAAWTTGDSGRPQIFFMGTPRAVAEFGPYQPKTWPVSEEALPQLCSP